jgi:hypothetical protein
LPKFGVLRGNPHRASHCRLAASAQRKAIDRRDHRLTEIFDVVQHALPEPAGLLRLIGIDMREFTDVGTGDESLVARAGEDHALHRRVSLCLLEGSLQISPRRRVERVEYLGPIDRHIGDRTFFSYKTFASANAVLGKEVGAVAGEDVIEAASEAMVVSPWIGPAGVRTPAH